VRLIYKPLNETLAVIVMLPAIVFQSKVDICKHRSPLKELLIFFWH
jgi:hypothetical protein